MRFVERPNDQDWDRIESELGVLLPADYKELMSVCGSGVFGQEITLYNPAGRGAYRLTPDILHEHREILRQDNLPFALWPDRDGGLTLGTTPSQFDIIARPVASDKGKVIVLFFGTMEIKEYDCSLCDLILSLYRGPETNDPLLLALREAAWPTGKEPLFTPAKHHSTPLGSDRDLPLTSPAPQVLQGESLEAKFKSLEADLSRKSDVQRAKRRKR